MDEQHPVPRQITTFKFKLIGFMTLEQFMYIIAFLVAGFLVYAIDPIPVLREITGILVVLIGFVVALVPYNDRPMDIIIRSFIKRMLSPTQFTYHKENKPLYFLDNLFFNTDPHVVLAHADSKDKLEQYLFNKQQKQGVTNDSQRILSVQSALSSTPLHVQGAPVQQTNMQQAAMDTSGQPTETLRMRMSTQPPNMQPTVSAPTQFKHQPFLFGIVRNKNQTPIPGVLVYVKDMSGNVVRILKTNPHGVFATRTPLPVGEYQIESKSSNTSFFFDTIKLQVASPDPRTSPIQITSKEML